MCERHLKGKSSKYNLEGEEQNGRLYSNEYRVLLYHSI